MPNPDRSFKEKEITAILKRAAELQGGSPDDRPIGLTEAELRRIGQETGIDPVNIAKAIAELESGPATDSTNIWGGPLSIRINRSLPGRIDDETWEEMIGEIRSELKDSGLVSERGLAREWVRSDGKQGVQNTHITATVIDGDTRLQLVWNEPVAAVPFYVMFVVASIITLPIVFESLGLTSPMGVGLYALIVAAMFLAARTVTSSIARKRKTQMKRLMSNLERIAEERGVIAEPVSALTAGSAKAATIEAEATQAKATDAEASTSTKQLVDIDDTSDATIDDEMAEKSRRRTR